MHRRRKRWLLGEFVFVFARVVVLNPIPRRRKRWLLYENNSFWTTIRCTGVANGDFGPKSGAQASQKVTSSWKLILLDQNLMHRGRKSWFWTLIRCTGVANGYFFLMKMITSWPQYEHELFWTKIRCTEVANCDFGHYYDVRALLKQSQNSVYLDRHVNKHLTKYLTKYLT